MPPPAKSSRLTHRADAWTSVTARSDSGHGQPLLAQRRKSTRALIEGYGCELLYLPHYTRRTSNGMSTSETETPRDSYDGERTKSEGTRTISTQHSITADSDLSDRYSRLCVLDTENSEVMKRAESPGIRRLSRGALWARSRCPWPSRRAPTRRG